MLVDIEHQVSQARGPSYDDAVAAFLACRSEESFRALFYELYPRVKRFLAVRGVSAQLAEDLAQEVLFTVYRRANQLRAREAFSGWVFRIARNELLQHLRRNGGSEDNPGLEALYQAAASPEAVESALLARYRVHEWLRCLDPQSRQILLLRFVDDLTYNEIGEVLDIPPGTVKWKVFEAKKRLAKYSRGKRDI